MIMNSKTTIFDLLIAVCVSVFVSFLLTILFVRDIYEGNTEQIAQVQCEINLTKKMLLKSVKQNNQLYKCVDQLVDIVVANQKRIDIWEYQKTLQEIKNEDLQCEEELK